MKKFIYVLALIFGLTAGCDYIDDPIQEGGIGPIPTDSVVQKVLVEDYTGHKCPNCPDAATEAEDLKAIYGDRVVVVAIHAGFFSSPSPGFETDFRTPAGDAMNTFFGFAAYPAGLVNRIGYPSQHILNFQAWPPAVAVALEESPAAKIEVNADLSGSTLSTSVEIEYQAEVDGDYSLIVWITEDGIIAPQVYVGQTIPDYEHNHVLRTAITPTWGDVVSMGAVDLDSTYTKTFSSNWNNEWNEQNCHVVAFLYDQQTLQVVQVEEIKL